MCRANAVAIDYTTSAVRIFDGVSYFGVADHSPGIAGISLRRWFLEREQLSGAGCRCPGSGISDVCLGCGDTQDLIRYKQTSDLRFVTFHCYRGQAFLGSGSARSLLEIATSMCSRKETDRNKSGPERLPAQKKKSSVISMSGVKLLIPIVQETTCAQNSRVPRAKDEVEGMVASTRLARISECEVDGVASYPVIKTCT